MCMKPQFYVVYIILLYITYNIIVYDNIINVSELNIYAKYKPKKVHNLVCI